jgi:c-di-GMP-binding flagellar brake protein YcgR
MIAFQSRWDASPGQTSRDRRRGQRAEVLWKGDYLVIDGSGARVWQRCYLVDISDGGAGIELHGDDLEVGQRVLLRLDPHPTYSDSPLQLRATVMNRRGSGKPPVYGLQFAGLMPAQREQFLQITMTARRDVRRRRRYRPDPTAKA